MERMIGVGLLGIFGYLLRGALLSLVILQTACTLLAGPKEVGSTKDGWYAKFPTGVDFGMSANLVDTVENKRGIVPSK